MGFIDYLVEVEALSVGFAAAVADEEFVPVAAYISRLVSKPRFEVWLLGVDSAYHTDNPPSSLSSPCPCPSGLYYCIADSN